jgi:hypothetical protein
MSDLNDLLYDVTADMFENLAFIFSAFEPEDSPEHGERTITAAVTFDGPFEGGLILSISEGLCPLIGANMLGLDFGETPSEEQQQDAFLELLNVLCGNTLTRVAGEEAVFNVGRAECVSDGQLPATITQYKPLACARIDLEDGRACATLYAPQDARERMLSTSRSR